MANRCSVNILRNVLSYDSDFDLKSTNKKDNARLHRKIQ